MNDRRPFFHSFAMAFFLGCFGIALILDAVQMIIGITRFSWGSAAWFFSALGIIAGIAYGAKRLSAAHPERVLKEHGKALVTAEGLTAGILLLSGFALRLLVIRMIPVTPASDFELYYNIASDLIGGTLRAEYCEYISLYPHFLGFPSVLSVIFRLFGTGVSVALSFNLICQMLSCFWVWRIARLLGGRTGGLIALACAALLPSAVLYSSMVAAEPFFTLLLLTDVWMFVRLMKPFREKAWNPWAKFAWLVCMSGLLAYAASIRPMALIFLIAAVICILSVREKPSSPPNHASGGRCMVDRGWVKCLILVAVYCVASWGLSQRTAGIIGRQPAGASVSYGYNLLVGLNQDSAGGWNPEDIDTLTEALESTGSAHEAQRTCRDLAVDRLRDGWTGIPVLLAEKLYKMWGNDQYGAYWNEIFLDRQEQLSPEWSDFLTGMTPLCDLCYLILLAGVVSYGLLFRRNKPDTGYVIVLLLCGTVALHLVLEAQNRYHYYALFLMAVLAGTGLPAFPGQASRLFSRHTAE